MVIDLLRDLKERVYPVGRLDYNTEGLLLLTNDGEWANRLMHPRHEVEKEYLVRVRGGVAPEQVRKLAEGVELEEGVTAPARVAVLRETGSSTWVSIVIHEGRYRQVRRMCEGVSLSVARLKRIRYGSLELGELKPGEHRLLSAGEAARLEGKPERRLPPGSEGESSPRGKTPRGGKKPVSGHAKPETGKKAPAGGRKPGMGKKAPSSGTRPDNGKRKSPEGGRGSAPRKPTPRNSPSSSR